MALDPTASFYDQWLAAMQGGAAAPAVDPLQVGAAEYGSTAPIVGPGAPTPPPPPPPPPPPQQIGPTPIAPAGELAAPTLPPPPAPPMPVPVAAPNTLPSFEPFDPSSWGSLPTPEMPAPGAPPTVPMPEVDAITGVAAAPPTDSIIQQQAPNVVRSAAGPGEQSLTEEELVALAHRDPVAYAKYNAQKDTELADFARQRDAEIKKRDAERAEGEYRDMVAARKRADEMSAQLDADAAALANEKPKGYMDSVGNALGAVAGIILGAIGSSATGGRNAGLDMVNAQIDRHIQAQRDEYNRKAGNIDRRTNAIARMREAGMSDYQAATTFRLAALGRAREQLLTEMQNYDPRGTAARHIAGSVLGMEQQMIASKEAARQKSLDEALKLAKEAREQQEAMDKHNAARAKLAGTGGGAKMPPEYFTAMGYEFAPPVRMTDKEYKAWVANKRANAELTKAQQDATAGKSQGMSKEELERGIGNLKNKDGKPFIAKGTPEEVGQLRKREAATKTVVRILDQIDRTRTGWSSDLVKGKEWQQLKADWAAAKGTAKDVLGLGALSGPDEKLIESYLSGGLDPTGIRNLDAGLSRARQNMINMTRDSLETAGLDAGVYDIPKPKLEPVEETPSDRRFKKALQAPTNTDIIEAAGVDVGGDMDEARRQYVAPGAAPTLDNVVLPDVRREIDALAAAAKGGDTESRAKLEKLLDAAPNAGVKGAVQAALIELGREPETYESAAGRAQATARETVPPIPLTPAPAPTVNPPKGAK